MKNAWSPTWRTSVQRRKQRKYAYNTPLHTRRKLLGAPLAKNLRKTQHKRSLPVRTGDKVKITRGQFKGKDGKVERVDTKKIKIFITGLERIKKDGSKSLIPFHPSNLIITDLETSDKRRLKKQSSKEPKTTKSEKPKEHKEQQETKEKSTTKLTTKTTTKTNMQTKHNEEPKK